MENILDLDPKKSNKTSWQIGVITNVVLGIIFFLMFCVESLDRTNKIQWLEVIFQMFLLQSFSNLLLSPISLLFSKKYWKKWLIMAALFFAGFFVVVASNSYINLRKTQQMPSVLIFKFSKKQQK